MAIYGDSIKYAEYMIYAIKLQIETREKEEKSHLPTLTKAAHDFCHSQR